MCYVMFFVFVLVCFESCIVISFWFYGNDIIKVLYKLLVGV